MVAEIGSRVNLTSRTATLLSRAIRAWDRLGVSTLQTPWFMGSPGVVVPLDELWLGRGKESMTASSTARIRDSIRRVAESTAGQALAGEGERKHDGEGGEDKRQHKEKGG